MTPPVRFESAQEVMRHAIALARQGLGRVEPNPAVGAVLVDSDFELLGAGWHQRFGDAHAEVNCLRDFEQRIPCAERRHDLLNTATLYVTLEPCCHFGKTPPCSEAVVRAGVRRVVIGIRDPSPHVAGGGLRQLEQAGIDVSVGLLDAEVRQLNAPFLKRLTTGLPWIIAKWAMTLDGRIATRTGASQWISGEPSRAIVHELRGRMDAIIVGAGTASADDSRLTARPRGPRIAARVVVDSQASLSQQSQLVQTARAIPVIVAASAFAPPDRVTQLEAAGVEVLRLPSEIQDSASAPANSRPSLRSLFEELSRRGMTNVLVEGGGELLGSLFDAGLADEVHVFIAPKIAGGRDAVPAVGGAGIESIPQFTQLDPLRIERVGDDVYLRGILRRDAPPVQKSGS